MRAARRGDLASGWGQLDVLVPALDQFDAELALQILNLRGQGRLGDGAMFGRRAEMAEADQRVEIAKLAQSGHRLDFLIERGKKSNWPLS